MESNGIARATLIGSLVPLCWFAIQIVHEAGHILAAWATGGTVTAVVLHPLAISRTDVAPNPSPLIVVWGGPAFGTVVPVLSWLIVRSLRRDSACLWRFFAGFCLVANGVYIGYGVIEAVGDAADMLRLGTRVWALAVFGLVMVPAGLALWHGQGSFFGLGAAARPVAPRHARAALGLLVLIVIGELIWSSVTGFR